MSKAKIDRLEARGRRLIAEIERIQSASAGRELTEAEASRLRIIDAELTALTAKVAGVARPLCV
jgi:hypothetical protein